MATRGAGSLELLSAMARDLGYHLHVIERKRTTGVTSAAPISVKSWKGAMGKGQPAAGPALMPSTGKVVHGNHIGGSLLGFPTANILPPPIKRLPRYGVYVSYTGAGGRRLTIKASPISAKSPR